MSRSFSFKIIFETLFDITTKDKQFSFIAKIAPGISCLGIIGHCLYTFKTTNNKIIIVEDKYQFTRNGYTEFMIIDKNGDHYNVNNSFWYWKWNSIEDWNTISLNDCIKIKYYSMRIPMFGLFPNIVGYKKESIK